MTTVRRLDDVLLAQLEESIKPVGQASTLPAELYTSADVLAFVRDALFAHDWLCVGRVDRVASVGDWFTKTILDEPIVAIGGGFSHVTPDLFDFVREAIAERAAFPFVAKVRVIASGLSGDGPLVGAAALIHRHAVAS